jgi:hypothetical protein
MDKGYKFVCLFVIRSVYVFTQATGFIQDSETKQQQTFLKFNFHSQIF